jgi:hypothetical protein
MIYCANGVMNSSWLQATAAGHEVGFMRFTSTSRTRNLLCRYCARGEYPGEGRNESVHQTWPAAESELLRVHRDAQVQDAGAFRNLYGFLSQIIPFGDSDHEKLYTYLRFFTRQLPRSTGPTSYFDDVRLTYYKLQKMSEGAIVLDPGSRYPLDGPTEVGTGQQRGPEIELSKL